MSKVTVVIPNYNGIAFMDKCLSCLLKQNYSDFQIIVVDNASEDNSELILNEYKNELDISLIKHTKNEGFSKAVNAGISASNSEYVILLNNDAYGDENFIKELVDKMESDERIFSAQALMLQEQRPTLVDSAGDGFSAFGWGFSKGKDKIASMYNKDTEIFSSCAGAAIYRKSALEEIGYFDETFFAYLEDMDLGYRARLKGYINVLASKAIVYHVGSGSSGSRHNAFKVKLSSRNSFLLMYKNFAWWQWPLNFLLIGIGYIIKVIFFKRKGLHKEYIAGVKEFAQYKRKVGKTKASRYGLYFVIQWKLWVNCVLRFFV